MYVTGHQVGRLVEIRIWTPVSAHEVADWGRELGAILQRIPGRYLCLVDLYESQVFPPPVADAYLETMRNDNARLERAAVLVGASATQGIQIQRMIREADMAARKVFQSARDIEAWLGEVMTEPEKQRLHAALQEQNRFEDESDVEPGARGSAVPFSFVPASHIPASYTPVSNTPVSNTPVSHAPSSPPKRPRR